MPLGAAADGVLLLGGGAGIVVHDQALCTLTAMGHDSAGRLIGFTAAQCGGPGSLVVAEGAEDHGAVGAVVAANEGMGYSVIEFDALKVKPIADYEGFGIYGIGSAATDSPGDGPAGAEPGAPEAAAAEPATPQSAAPQAAGPEAADTRICRLGRGSGLHCFDFGPAGIDLGDQQWWHPGDDGAPITVDDRIVGMVRGATAPSAPLEQSGSGVVMFKAILDDLNAKGGAGSGFGLG